MSLRPLLLSLPFAASCARPPTVPASATGPADLLLITLDTARADHFSYVGDSPVQTPRIDALAASGTVFLQAVAPAPLTAVSHATILTGLEPPRHGVRDNGRFVLAPEHETLAEQLLGAGYRTAAFVGAAVLERRVGLDQGFEVYRDDLGVGEARLFTYVARPGEAVVAEALGWLQGQSAGPTFAWVHLFDAHAPYAPPEPERSVHGDSYRGEIAHLDRVVGSLLDGYHRTGREPVVVLTADHGESLGEHGESTHGVFVYDSTLRVPLVIQGPGVPAGGRVVEQVGLVDLLPTILELLGQPVRPGLDGVDLGPALQGRPTPGADRALWVESQMPGFAYGWADLVGVRTAGAKLVSGARDELHLLGEDPGERIDRSAERPELLAALQVEVTARQTLSEARPLDASVQEALETLGYLAGAPAPEGQVARPDPRDRIAVAERLHEAERALYGGDAEAALGIYRAVVVSAPESLLARASLARVLTELGRGDEALAALDSALSVAPEVARLHQDRGVLLEQAGRFEEAAEAYGRALALVPDHRVVRQQRWVALIRAGMRDQVLAEARSAVAAEDCDGPARTMALKLQLEGEPAGRAQAAVRRAVEACPEAPDLRLLLAEVLLAGGAGKPAEAEARRVLLGHPESAPASAVLGRALLAQGRRAEARVALLQAVDAGDRSLATRQALEAAR